MVFPANNSKATVHYWAGKFPGLLGHLYSPGGFRGPYAHLPYALDNGAFSAYRHGRPWDADAYRALLDRAQASDHAPRWVLVPDVVADRTATLRLWDQWSWRLRGAYGWPLAFAVQDGMTPVDVPPEADVIFVGGTTGWKWRTLRDWRAEGCRVHVGRVNTERLLWQAHAAGAESCDGTGWFRGDAGQLAGLENYLARMTAGLGPDPRICVEDLFGEPRFLGGRAA